MQTHIPAPPRDQWLPPWYATLYHMAEASAEYRRSRTMTAAAMTDEAGIVALTPDDFHRCYNLFACWVNEGEPGVAMDEAMISGLAPGRADATVMVAKSTWGSEATGSTRKAMTPARVRAKANKVVATGRLMKGAEMFMGAPES